MADAGAAAVPFAPPPREWLGRRVRVAGNLATVRWGPGHVAAPPPKGPAGEDAPAAPATVEVVGIEYDEAGLGKHDGTHQGTRLFECPDKCGSFAKVEKVELGVPVQRALAQKYFPSALGEESQESAIRGTRSEVMDDLGYTDSKGREKAMAVEIVGRYAIEQRQSRLEGFMEVAIADCNLESRYPDDVWEGDWSFPNLKSLWLDKTLITDWADILAICELAPPLEWLSLAKTRLAPLKAGCPLPQPRGLPDASSNQRGAALVSAKALSGCQLKTLVLNSTGVTWETLLSLDGAGVFPCLEHLHLAQNGLTEGVPEGIGGPFPRLRSLGLDSNGISDWGVLKRAVTTFPALEGLHLNANKLGADLAGLATAAADRTPRRLTALFLNENPLGSWRAIGALASYALLELRLQRPALTEGDSPVASPMLVRQILIALMPTMLRLNASEVTVKERTASERYFLGLAQQPASAVMEGIGGSCDVPAHVSRLCAVHGAVVGGDVTEEAQATRSALVNALVEVTLRPVGVAILDQAPAMKKLPHTMTVAELRRLCHSLFKKVPVSRIRLVLSDGALPFGVPLEDEARELGFYGVGDGAEVRVGDAGDDGPLAGTRSADK